MTSSTNRWVPKWFLTLGVALIVATPSIGCERHEHAAARPPEAHPCLPPDTTAPEVEFALLPGTYRMLMHVTDGRQADSSFEGRLDLERWARSGADVLPGVSWTIEGYTNIAIDTSRSGGLGPATARIVTTTDTADNLVGSYRLSDSSYFLDQGEIVNTGGIVMGDGLTWIVWRATENGLRGTWGADFWRPPYPRGYFCARRDS